MAPPEEHPVIAVRHAVLCVALVAVAAVAPVSRGSGAGPTPAVPVAADADPAPARQRELLELEGVSMRGGRVDLARYRWSGPRREWRVDLTVELPLGETRRRRVPPLGRAVKSARR